MKARILLPIALVVGALLPGPAPAERPAEDPAIVPHPSELTYPELTYDLPEPERFREVLPNGMVVYIAEDRMLPTFDMTVMIRTGGALDPEGKAGLASLVGDQLRDGGTESRSPEELDEEVEFLAARLFSGAGDTSARAGVSLLSKDLDKGLELLMDMLRNPRFDRERLRKAKERILQNIKRRNDSTGSIESVEWGFLMNGPDHFSNRYPTTKSMEAISREDLLQFHEKYYHPGNMMVAVAGDFDREEMLGKLRKAFADWPEGTDAPRDLPDPDHRGKPGIYVVNKPDVNQGRVSLGHKSVMFDHPDRHALQVMNAILGQAGFSSRLMQKVRSDEGLAYSVGSILDLGAFYPGDFRCYFQTKSNAVPYATRLTLDQIRRIRTEKVSADELAAAVNLAVESFPQRFPNRMAILRTYLSDEYIGRDPHYWQTYLDHLQAVTADDVLRVAKEHLHPDRIVILAVGNADDIIAGGHDKQPDLTMRDLGSVTVLEPRDPETLQRNGE